MRPAAAGRSAWCWVLLAVSAWGCAYTRGAHDAVDAPLDFPPAARRHGVQVAEIGIPAEDLQGNPGLADARVGFGLSSILVEALSDSGHFDLLEAQEEILERHRSLWQRTADGFYAEDRQAAGLEQSAYRARARVSYARAARRGLSIGPFTSQTETLRVSVRVCLEAVTTGEALCREGDGEAEQLAGGAIYEYRGDRLAFEKTAAGLATRRAVRQAVYELVGSMPPYSDRIPP